jgi:DNA-binding NarL/FixJ family response regulator
MKIRIVVGCYNYIIGESLKYILKEEKNISVLGIFNESNDIVEVSKLEPDLIITDYKLFKEFPERFMDNNRTSMLVIGDSTMPDDIENKIPELVAMGVHGILSKETHLDVVKKAIKVIYVGELWLDRRLIKNIISYVNSVAKRKIILTEKEREIIELICSGYRNKEIAQRLEITEQTVKSHCNKIFKKIGVTDRVQLVLYSNRLWSDIFLT